MRFTRKFGILAALCSLVLVILLSACDQNDATPTPVIPPPQPTSSSNGEITVFAASSLTDAFNEIAKGATSDTTVTDGKIKKVNYNFAGSQALVTQLSQGAKADLLVTADEQTMRSAVDAGVVLTNTYRTFASNKLAVVTAPGSDKVLTLQDLAKPGLKLVLAADAVPAGNYSMQILDKLSADPAYGSDFKEKAMANVVSREDNVRQVATKVQLGEADAGIVYLTDAKSTDLPSIEIPDQFNVVAEYFLSVLPNAVNESDTRLFVGYLFSDAGQKALHDFGFGPPIQR